MSELHKNMINFFQPLFSHENRRCEKKQSRPEKTENKHCCRYEWIFKPENF